MTRYSSREKPSSCPKCGSKKIARILRGYPAMSPEFREELDNGTVTLGGCEVSDDDPAWECPKCGEVIHRQPDDASDDKE